MTTITKPKVEFRDAQKMHFLHPKWFDAPTAYKLQEVQVGHYVKICADPERFWVQVTQRDGDKLVGKVNNDLVCTHAHGLSCDDYVEFETRHIYMTDVPDAPPGAPTVRVTHRDVHS